jgi:folate-binding protein YgfZ
MLIAHDPWRSTQVGATSLRMTNLSFVAPLQSRAVTAVGGPDWRDFLQGLITQDALTLSPGEIRLAALLTPQGRLLFDLFLLGQGHGCLIDCAATDQAALVDRLTLYRLRAKVDIAASSATVLAAWGTDDPPAGFCPDPRAPALGSRAYGVPIPDGVTIVDEAAYDAHRLSLGIPATPDWAGIATYPIEANFDLLSGIDFKKGCFVGQETTSRMKRRGAIRNRMAPIALEGPPPEAGAELLAGDLRAGEIRSVQADRAMALLRLDRLETGPLTYGDGHLWRPLWPDWLPRGD